VLGADPSVIEELALEAPRPVGFAKKLRAAVTEAAARGFAISHGERELGASGVAAPVRRPDGRVVAAIAVGGPSTRFSDDRLPSYVNAVRRCADTISATGWSGFSAT
jgi:DNA-binding IclR family transcriptional regulator